MNIINFELKNNKKFLIGFLISVSLISLLFISFYPMLKNDLQAFSDVMKNYPAIIQNMFGFNEDLLTSVLGYYGTFAFTFILLFSAIFSTILGFSILSKELMYKVTEFLYVKPIKRERIIFYKYLSGILLIIIFNICLLLINFIILNFMDKIDIKLYILITLTIMFVQFSLYSISVLISSLIKVKSDIALGLATTFLFYIGSIALSNDFKILIPFKYFDIVYIMGHRSYEIFYLVLTFIIMITSLLVSIRSFQKKDL